MFLDARLPLRFGTHQDRTPGEAVLTDGPDPGQPPSARFDRIAPPAHPIDCACCNPRTAAALSLASLFRDRALTPGPAFRSVLAVVTPEGETAIRDALTTDPLVSARYRLAVSIRRAPRC